MSFCRTCTLPPYWQGAKDREWKKYPVSIYVILVEKRKYRLLTDGRCVVARTGRAVDHHLTTLPLGSSPCGNFHVPTSFSLRNNQCRNLCTLHKSLRWFIAFSRMSQFSDSVGRWFESSRAHQNLQRNGSLGGFLLPIITLKKIICTRAEIWIWRLWRFSVVGKIVARIGSHL